jgi:hypothetical protein
MIADPSIVHGTPTGHDAGCRGSSCTNHRTGLMTCTEAHIRYQGDYAYRKAVDAGTATAEREVFAKPACVVVAVKRKPKALATPKLKPEPKVRKRRLVAGHGSVSMYVKGCHKRELCPMPEGGTCSDVMLDYGRTRPKRVKKDHNRAAEVAPQKLGKAA